MPRPWRIKRLSRVAWCSRQRTLTWISILIIVLLWVNMRLMSCVTENTESVPSIASPNSRQSDPPSPERRGLVREQSIFEVAAPQLTVDPDRALLYGRRRRNQSELTIGIPTVQRHGVDYLEKTLYSLIINAKASQRMSIVVVVFMVDRNETWVRKRSKQLAGKYPKLIRNGFLQIVHPHDQSIYPDFTKIKRTFNDTATRVAWRAKQNIDYAYLFSYSKNISRYYLQLEDDVISAHNYYDDMLRFIQSKSDTFWYCLEFTYLGFIGKLFRSSDLQELSEYLLMFFDEQPGDLLLKAIKQIKTQWHDILIEKSLFQHKGIISSLSDKKQTLYDGRFKDSFVLSRFSRKRFYHVNPSALIDSKIETYSEYEPVHAYDLSDKYFWGVDPKQGDYFRITFEGPQNISRLFIDSGEATKQSDMLHHATLLVSTGTDVEHPCQNLVNVTNFVNGDVDTRTSNISLPVNIDCIVIELTANQSDWIIIREIAIFLPGEPEVEEEPNQISNSIQTHGESKMIKLQTWKRLEDFKPKFLKPRIENGVLLMPGQSKKQNKWKEEINNSNRQKDSHQNPPHEKVKESKKRRDNSNRIQRPNLIIEKSKQKLNLLEQKLKLSDPKFFELLQQQNSLHKLMKIEEAMQKSKQKPLPHVQGQQPRRELHPKVNENDSLQNKP
ncbi:alpha-1,6-mannosyl-glycoprotein 4-beta-N-acetylglucosaminyltransferase-like [Pecten maximus]|uniref:alpha-1,6-mannosyl-glycoprotein 4-beta-N-acetylglucosaminyltransferase-like n=1 Tax=Pecten maximus TaxID=6579 RepID=UPI001458AEB3|nr:alpha-1,6-mannosyl-glycoprotein 4-beta-N-acetylglucosaminyltransferase-like [Pecten maximus]